jgi:hypothetical protein
MHLEVNDALTVKSEVQIDGASHEKRVERERSASNDRSYRPRSSRWENFAADLVASENTCLTPD